MKTDFDVLIIGAGLSGISMACQLKTQCPGKRVALLERRAAIGGTWDLFRYPVCAPIRTCSPSATSSAHGTS